VLVLSCAGLVLSRATRLAISSIRASSCSSFCVSRHARSEILLSINLRLVGEGILRWVCKGNPWPSAEMAHCENLKFVCDANGPTGLVIQFSESDFDAYSMPDLALVGAFQTKAGP
jgi:hypothetical protein